MRYLLLIIPLLLLAGCARFGAAAPQATSAPAVVAVPTFTPTPDTAVTASSESQDEAAKSETGVQPSADEEDAAEPVEATVEPGKSALSNLLPTVTPAAQANDDEPSDEPADAAVNDSATSVEVAAPRLVVGGEIVNVRQGPGVDYPTVGAVNAGEAFALTGRNEAGDWWQVCCFGELRS